MGWLQASRPGGQPRGVQIPTTKSDSTTSSLRTAHDDPCALPDLSSAAVDPVAASGVCGLFDGLAHEPGAMACSRCVSCSLDARQVTGSNRVVPVQVWLA
jgi:hypothetical protein